MPGKNVKRLGPHPLIAYTIAAALDAGVFGTAIVSTDSREIAEIARYYGADVPFLRPAAYATSTSPDIEWVTHALERLRDHGHIYDCFSILRPTSPFRTAATIGRAWAEFQADPDVDSLRAVELCRQHPGKMWIVSGRRMTPLLPGGPDDRPWHSTQYAALPPVYVQNASLEIAWTRVVLEGGTIAGEVLMPFFTDPVEGFDINDSWDWLVAEEMIRRGEAIPPAVGRPPLQEGMELRIADDDWTGRSNNG